MYSSLNPSLNKGKNMTLKPLVPNDSKSYQRSLHFYTCRMTPCSLFFYIHVAISSIHETISFEFRFWAHFFALRITDTRSKIFPTALKKFALRAENVHVYLCKKSEGYGRKLKESGFWFIL